MIYQNLWNFGILFRGSCRIDPINSSERVQVYAELVASQAGAEPETRHLEHPSTSVIAGLRVLEAAYVRSLSPDVSANLGFGNSGLPALALQISGVLSVMRVVPDVRHLQQPFLGGGAGSNGNTAAVP